MLCQFDQIDIFKDIALPLTLRSIFSVYCSTGTFEDLTIFAVSELTCKPPL